MSDRRELSMRLNDVLEMIGVTEEMRSFHQRVATMREILYMVYMKRTTGERWIAYLCGSSWEGTVTPDLASDVDIIYCHSDSFVVADRPTEEPGEFPHAVRENLTCSGFVKLQLMRDGQLLTDKDVEECDMAGFDGEGRACRKHEVRGTMHGQAAMRFDEQGRHSTDTVFACQCKGIPLFAREWITRERLFGWPTQQMIDELMMMGCLYVGVGYFQSREKDLEWRLSFSVQERLLMKSLNITQHRVYVIMKMIKRNILEKCLNEESLSSYHFKTSLFYMVETTPESMWVPENLIDCLIKCLEQLLRWIKDRVCPSFFLKGSNLFDKEGFLRLAEPLDTLISLLLHTGHQFLYMLQSDRVGEMLKNGELKLFKPVSESSVDKYIMHYKLISINIILFTFRRVVRPHTHDQDAMSLFMTELEEFEQSENTLGYTEDEYRDALSYALPWLHLSIGLEFFARAATCPDKHECANHMTNAHKHMRQAIHTDLVNNKLTQATILLRQEKLEWCFRWLQELENCWTYRVVTYCPCTKRNSCVYMNEQQLCDVASEYRDMSIRQLMGTRCASCVIFERSQIDLVPPVLRYEMYRSLFTRPGSRDEEKYAWFDRAPLDAKVYLYMLKYLVCSKLDKELDKNVAMDNIAYITLHDEYKVLSHRETAFNILGWIYLQERRVVDAVWCFLQSWQIRPHHNAAKFHVLIESFRLAENKRILGRTGDYEIIYRRH